MPPPETPPDNLSRAVLLDAKRDGLSDIALAALYDTAPDVIAVLRAQYGVPALACDLNIQVGRSKVRSSPARSAKGGVRMGRSPGSAPDGAEGLRTTDKAEAHLTKFFSKRPNFSADNVPVKPMSRMTASVPTVVGCGASPLYFI